MLNKGQRVKVKPLKDLRTITGIGWNRQIMLSSGLVFTPVMMCYADQIGKITDIAKPGKDNLLKEPSYKIGEVDLYWTENLLEVVE